MTGPLRLLAQMAPDARPGMDGPLPTWAMISAMVLVGVIMLVLVPTVLGLRHARRTRELEHAERMRALELGHPLPGSEAAQTAMHSPGVMIGLWVPLSVFGIAFVATQSGRQQHEAWIAAAIVGTAGVICGTVLTLRGHATGVTTAGVSSEKPRIDPAAFDDLANRR